VTPEENHPAIKNIKPVSEEQSERYRTSHLKSFIEKETEVGEDNP
jgi:ribosomal protein S8